MSRFVVILDFDKTIIDVDSDYWVVGEFGFNDFLNQLLPTMPLNSVMSIIMKKLHSQGIIIQQIVNVLKRIPIHPKIVSALKTAHSLGCELRIISDANTFFINTILEHVSLLDCFSEINTNPGFVDDEGRLNILPFHGHGCQGLCSLNMCKGLIIERIQSSLSRERSNRKIIYVGDGEGDYCPSLKLTHSDFLMPRKDFPVWDLIFRNPAMIKAEICGWLDGEEFECVLLEIIGGIPNNGSQKIGAQFFTIPIVAQERMVKALSVP